ncbi:MAG: AAA family ATPase [Chloroflexi bacterium]|nr:AAA family ATPase [Chloroflexota bacterium]
MTEDPFLLQMAGVPGSGKSALARLIGRSTGAVVLDKDVLKTAALAADAEEPLAGEIAYEAFFALAHHLLGQGLSVILDSPSFWETIPKKGAAIAAGRCIPYYFIECLCPDREELARRLRDRPRLPSNPGEESLEALRTTFTPPGAYLRVDTTQAIEDCLAMALDYLAVATGDSVD